jgi:hypothetical protein
MAAAHHHEQYNILAALVWITQDIQRTSYPFVSDQQFQEACLVSHCKLTQKNNTRKTMHNQIFTEAWLCTIAWTCWKMHHVVLLYLTLQLSAAPGWHTIQKPWRAALSV